MNKTNVSLDFYVAECGEFPSLGEYYDCLCMRQAEKMYRKMLEGNALSGCALGFTLHDPSSIYDGIPCPIVEGRTVFADRIGLVKEYEENALVKETLASVAKAFPDFNIRGTMSVKGGAA